MAADTLAELLTAYNLVRPRQQLSITVLGNTEAAQPQGIAETLAGLAGS